MTTKPHTESNANAQATPQSKLIQFRISLRSLLLVVAATCVLIAICSAITQQVVSGGKAAKEQQISTLLKRDNRIERIAIRGYEEEFGLFTVTSVEFAIRNKPASRVELFIPDGETDLDSLRVIQIGNLSPLIAEWDEKAQAWTPRCPALGNDAEYRPPLPWKDMSLSDVVTHYDELVNYFDAWPVSPKYKAITTATGKRVRCCIEPPGVNTKSEFLPVR